VIPSLQCGKCFYFRKHERCIASAAISILLDHRLARRDKEVKQREAGRGEEGERRRRVGGREVMSVRCPPNH
jgi:hypothetical protein